MVHPEDDVLTFWLRCVLVSWEAVGPSKRPNETHRAGQRLGQFSAPACGERVAREPLAASKPRTIVCPCVGTDVRTGASLGAEGHRRLVTFSVQCRLVSREDAKLLLEQGPEFACVAG